MQSISTHPGGFHPLVSLQVSCKVSYYHTCEVDPTPSLTLRQQAHNQAQIPTVVSTVGTILQFHYPTTMFLAAIVKPFVEE